jgi:AcrR family transcriptional regulator
VGGKALDVSRDGNGGASASGQVPASRRKLSPGPGLAAQEVAAHQLARVHDATIQIVAERGYRALKVRDIVHRAEVSTRAFYEHFSSKEDCFLQTYDLISRRATRRLIAAQTGECDWRKRPRLVFEEFVKELEAEPEGARLALIEAYAAGDAALDRAWRAERAFEGMLTEALARTPTGVVVPPLIVQGMVAGVATVSRSRMLSGRVADLANVGGELVDWAMCYPDRTAAELSRLDSQSVWKDTTLEPVTGLLANEDGEPRSSTGDRALILTAVIRLAAAKGYAGLTAPRIRSAAGVSRRKFDAYFDDLEDCYLAALEQCAGEAMAQAARAQAAARTKTGGVYRAIAALSDHIAGDPFLSRVCLTDDFPTGPNGVRSRQRLIDAAVELLAGNSGSTPRPARLVEEASTGAVWSLFHHHVIRDRALRQQISATLAYLAMAPIAGASSTITAIQDEQSP